MRRDPSDNDMSDLRLLTRTLNGATTDAIDRYLCPDINNDRSGDTTSLLAGCNAPRADVREKGFATCRGTRSSAPKSSKQPPKTREPEQLRSWLVICGSANVQDYDVADFSTVRSGCFLLLPLGKR